MTKIQWTDETSNPIVVMNNETGEQEGWHCFKVSPGCANCYSEKLNGSGFYNGNGIPYRVTPDGALPAPYSLHLRRDLLEKWTRKRTPKRIFVCSMTDLFGEFVSEEWVFDILDHMWGSPRMTFQLLTKRAERAYVLITQWLEARGLKRVPPNIWIGISAENQEWLDRRATWLRQIPAWVRWVSAEPLLGPLDFSLLSRCHVCQGSGSVYAPDMGHFYPCPTCDGGGYAPWINWIVIGGESGPNARPFKLDWARRIIWQSKRAGIPVFVKQLGARASDERSGIAGRYLDVPDEAQPLISQRLEHPKGGDPAEWPRELQVRQFPRINPRALYRPGDAVLVGRYDDPAEATVFGPPATRADEYEVVFGNGDSGWVNVSEMRPAGG